MTIDIQDLNVEALLAIFARLGLRDLYTVEKGWFSITLFFSLLLIFLFFSRNYIVNVRNLSVQKVA